MGTALAARNGLGNHSQSTPISVNLPIRHKSIDPSTIENSSDWHWIGGSPALKVQYFTLMLSGIWIGDGLAKEIVHFSVKH